MILVPQTTWLTAFSGSPEHASNQVPLLMYSENDLLFQRIIVVIIPKQGNC